MERKNIDLSGLNDRLQRPLLDYPGTAPTSGDEIMTLTGWRKAAALRFSPRKQNTSHCLETKAEQNRKMPADPDTPVPVPVCFSPPPPCSMRASMKRV